LTGKQNVNRFRRKGTRSDLWKMTCPRLRKKPPKPLSRNRSKRPLRNAAPFGWRRRLTNRTGIGRAF
jgi:hypothetical protein